MKVLSVGVGAVGGLVAARLTAAGADVSVVDLEPAHVALLRLPGLRVGAPDGESRVKLDACLPHDLSPEAVKSADVVLLAVRSGATASALDPIASRLRSDADVVSLQNGLNEDTIASIVGPQRTIGCVVGFGATWVGSGHVILDADGPLHIGRLDGSTDARLEAIREVCDLAFPTRITGNILGALWGKMLVNSMTVLGALAGMLTGELLGTPERRRLVADVVAEGVRVARAEGVRLPKVFGGVDAEIVDDPRRWHEEMERALVGVGSNFGTVKSVTWRDFELGRPTEIDAVSGEIVRRAERHRLRVPLVSGAYHMLREIEAGDRCPSAANLEELPAPSPLTSAGPVEIL